MATVDLPSYNNQPTDSLTTRPSATRYLKLLQFQSNGVTSTATPKWSESFLLSWMLLIASTESTAQSALRAMWSMLLRPWKTRSDVTIRRFGLKAS